MAETTQPMRTVLVDYQCDLCGTGRMRPRKIHGNTVYLSSHPPQYVHQCDQAGCWEVRNFPLIYPTTRLEPVDA